MLLAIDTSTRQVGIALFDGARILNESTWTSPFHHTIELAPAAALSLSRADIAAEQIQAVGVAVGPGSFTALRTGLAFAKGFALAHKLPILGIPSLDVLAAAQPGAPHPLLAALEAGRKRLAVGEYTWTGERWHAAGAPVLSTIEELAGGLDAPVNVCGEFNPDALALLGENPHVRLAPPHRMTRRPGVLAELAWARHGVGERDDPDTLAPIYLSTAGIDE